MEDKKPEKKIAKRIVIKTPKPQVKKIGVVFVCTGNTCRSPQAEMICKSKLRKRKKASKFAVSSCGVSAYEGEVMSSYAEMVLKAGNVSVTKFASKTLSEKIIAKTDYFVCMTQSHKNAISMLKNVYTIAEISGFTDVSDPYGGTYNEYKEVYDYLDYVMDGVIDFIERDYEKNNPPHEADKKE